MLEQGTTSTTTPKSGPAPRSQQPANAVDPAASLTQSADQALQSFGVLYKAVDGVLQKQVQERPYVTLAAAAGVGFVLGGGLRSPFGQLLVRTSVRAFGPPLVNTVLHGVLERAGLGALTEPR